MTCIELRFKTEINSGRLVDERAGLNLYFLSNLSLYYFKFILFIESALLISFLLRWFYRGDGRSREAVMRTIAPSSPEAAA